ncbi:MAG: excinuclease ABC subunit UvrC [Deltaproteobacteria bacterium]|nr:excinuclease ABC subunit UvrC [Deltaproteobacteria bacterium]
MSPDQIAELLARVPSEPGVYLMKDRKGRVIYVGKAKDLRVRVRSYFRSSGDERAFVTMGLLGKLLFDVETVVVNNEKEALLLENNLIKEHQPRFNVKLTDDKSYLVLRIDSSKRYPRIDVVRRIRDDGALYFGPYHSATSLRETLRLINRHFQLRTCTDHVLQGRKRPCILYQIKRCPAPCVFPVDEGAYREKVQDVALFLGGKKDELLPRLKARMKDHASRLEYERAAQVRDQIFAVERTLTAQAVVSPDLVDQDVVGTFRRDDLVEVAVLLLRQGKLIGRRSFLLKDQEVPDEETVRNFVRQYYEMGALVPDEVLLPVEIEDPEVISEWLRDLGRHKVVVCSPKRGPRTKLIALATKNAESSFASRKSQSVDALASLEKLMKRLSLRRLPRRIECFDVAHIQGAAVVASMVVMVDGEPAPSEYRKFKVKTATNDDFAAMYEVLSRRFRRLPKDGQGEGWSRPDLLIVDGGKGQLSTALAALRDSGWEISADKGFDVIGLAKERTVPADEAEASEDVGASEPTGERVLVLDRVYLRNVKDPIRLRANSTELFLLARIRDEAHRFANTFHRKLRKSRMLRSVLEDVPSVGKKRKQLLLKAFGSVKKIRAASVDEIAKVPGMTRASAEAVKKFFGD